MILIPFFIFGLGALVAAVPNQHLGIINGRNATRGEFKYIASFQLCTRPDDCIHDCNAIVISQSWALIVADCVTVFDYYAFQVHAGMFNLHDPKRQIRTAEKAVRHEKYDPSITESDYNIAVIKVDTPFIFNDMLQPATLPQANSNVSEGEAVITGFGAADYNSLYSIRLQTSTVEVVNTEACLDYIGRNHPLPEYHNSVVCTGPGSCVGDSTAPVVQNGTVQALSDWALNLCDPLNAINVYTKVSPYISWIQENIDEELTLAKN
ncbi:trypsin-4 [Diabrotica virgifera virgifera]|uniref:Trypsin-4-like n=1 Tax=Diabrotica virgifera virgifera TaxID=50390 RepID=A0A6P7G826_DIAVI|nr:trypsin-4 [Diabrotica virgifera virgifera]